MWAAAAGPPSGVRMADEVGGLAAALGALPTDASAGRLAAFKAKPSSQDEDERRRRCLQEQKEYVWNSDNNNKEEGRRC